MMLAVVLFSVSVQVPWVEDGLWPFSTVGRRPAPEQLLQLAARAEKDGLYARACYYYERVLSDYGDAYLPVAFGQAILGKARCLLAAGYAAHAAEVLLSGCGRNRPLCGNEAARELLERLLRHPAVAKERALLRRLRRVLRRWPKPPRPKERLVKRKEETPAAGALARARFYLRRGEAAAAAVYLRYLLERYPGSPQAKAAAELLARIDSRGTGG